VTGTDPKDEIATANRVLNALASISEGKPDRAIAVLEQAVAAAPNMYLAQYVLGAALAEKQRYAQAIEHLHKAIELRPGSARAQYEMGASLVKTGDFKTAAAHLELAVVRLPDFGKRIFCWRSATTISGRPSRHRLRSRRLPARHPRFDYYFFNASACCSVRWASCSLPRPR